MHQESWSLHPCNSNIWIGWRWGQLRQEDRKFEDSLSNIVRHCLERKRKGERERKEDGREESERERERMIESEATMEAIKTEIA
jgi:hypothetical protein